MSLVRACLRLAVKMALRQSAWPEVRIYDTNNAPLDETVQDSQPFMCVITDNDHGEVEGRDIYAAGGIKLVLAIEFGLANAIQQTPEGAAIAIPDADDAFELVLDILEGQVDAGLIDPVNTWGELARAMILKFHEVECPRAGSREKGVRWAAREKRFTVDLVAGPPRGVVLEDYHPVQRFLAAAAACDDPGIVKAAALISAQLSTTAAPSWLQAQALLGLTERETRDIGIAPPDVIIPDHAEAPLLEEITTIQEPIVPPGRPIIEGIP